MSFRQWIRTEYCGHVFIFYETTDLVAAENATYVIEGGRVWNLDNQWSVRMDNPHAPNMQKHTHVMFKGNDVSIINRDGTQSHGTNRDKVPNWVIDGIRQRGLIEATLLVEGSMMQELRVTYGMITAVHRRSIWHDLLSTIS
jgi:hypothetical protein